MLNLVRSTSCSMSSGSGADADGPPAHSRWLHSHDRTPANLQLRSSLELETTAELAGGNERANESRQAFQRLVELSDVEPPRRKRRLETAKLGLAVATWGTFVVLLFETKLPSG